MPDEQELENISCYVGIQYDIGENGANVSLQLPISIRVFFIAVILAEAENRCVIDDISDNEDDNKEK